MRTKNHRGAGFTLVEIMIVVTIIGLLAAIAIPNFIKARNASQTSACVANLKQIQGAIHSWALETKKAGNVAVVSTEIFGPNNYIKVKPQCPGGGTYAMVMVQDTPTCTVAGHTLPQ